MMMVVLNSSSGAILLGLLLLAVLLALPVTFCSNLLPPVTSIVGDSVCLPDPFPTDFPPDGTCAQDVLSSENLANSDMGKTTDEICEYYGYSVGIHFVTTQDGYILTLHRITGGPVSPPPATGKPSVYVHHGMGGASDNWLLQTPYRNLAFMLADAGYDVWLTNCRGTSYSLGHTTWDYSKNYKKYWDFSWHEMAMNDVPATIDYIIAVSGNPKIFYVGFSMGTTVYFVTLSELPQYNSKIIASCFMLSPVAFNGHSNSPLRLLSPTLGTGGQYLADPIFQGRLDPNQKLADLFNLTIGTFCVPTALRCGICDNTMFALFGFDTTQMNYTSLPNLLSKFPNNISIKTFAHYMQNMVSCGFRQFDYGVEENPSRYGGSVIPPAYDLSKITAKTYFYYGDKDNLAVPQDVKMTADQMKAGTLVEIYRVDWTMFNHIDFQIAKDADTLVYSRVVSTIKNIPLPY